MLGVAEWVGRKEAVRLVAVACAVAVLVAKATDEAIRLPEHSSGR